MKIIVMTGVTGGLGAEALKHIIQQPEALVLIGARGKNRAVPAGCEAFPLDLSSLQSVRDFAALVKKRIGNQKIDDLVLNAGASFASNTPSTVDGFSPTFGTNHLSHYLLSRLLLDSMATDSKIIFTTSDTHDPGLFPVGPKILNVKELARPSDPKKGTGQLAYSASKLCNLLTARYLSESDIVKKKGITVIAYNPGATAGTSLGGQQTAFMKFMMSYVLIPIMKFIGLFKSQYAVGTAARAGEALSELVLSKVKLPQNKFYASLVRGVITFPNPSKLAQTTEAKENLWNESAKMVGLPIEI